MTMGALCAHLDGSSAELQNCLSAWPALFDQAPVFVASMLGPTHIFEIANAAYMQLVGHRAVIGKPIREALPDIEGQGFYELLDGVFTTGKIGRAHV